MKPDNNQILGKIIDLMRAEGLDITSPYDVENFFEDHCSHSKMFKTGRFNQEFQTRVEDVIDYEKDFLE